MVTAIIVTFAVVGGWHLLRNNITVNVLSGKRKRNPIKITNSVWAPNAYIYIAEEKGFFADEGVDVELFIADDYHSIIQMYKNKEVDGGFFVLMDNLKLLDDGIESKIIMPTEYTFGADAIVGKLEFTTVHDLRGRTIGIDSINSFSHFIVLQILEKHGLGEGDVFFANVPAEQVPNAIRDGKIDAGHTFEPGISEAKQSGYIVIAGSEEIPGVIIGGLNFHKQTVDERSDDIQKIVNAWVRAKAFAKNNDEEAMGIMSRAFGLTREEFTPYFDGLKILNIAESKALFKKSSQYSIYNSLLTASNFLVERGQLSHMPNLDDMIKPQFIENAK